MGLNSQVEVCGFPRIPNSDGFIFELQFHTPGSFNRKNGPGHFLYEHFRDPAVQHGVVGGRKYEGDRYRQILYMLMALLWNRKDKLGRDFRPGDIVNSAIPQVDDYGEVSKTQNVYKYQPFLPYDSISDYQGLYPDLDRPDYERRTVWISKAQSSKKFSHVLDGLIAQRNEQIRRRQQRRLMLERQFPKRKHNRSISSSSKGEDKDNSGNDDDHDHDHDGVVHHHRHDSFGEGLICPDCKLEFGSIETLQRHANEVHHHVLAVNDNGGRVTQSTNNTSPITAEKKKMGWRDRLRRGFYA